MKTDRFVSAMRLGRATVARGAWLFLHETTSGEKGDGDGNAEEGLSDDGVGCRNGGR